MSSSSAPSEKLSPTWLVSEPRTSSSCPSLAPWIWISEMMGGPPSGGASVAGAPAEGPAATRGGGIVGGAPTMRAILSATSWMRGTMASSPRASE